jgi:alcohol dehydrogenase
MKALVYLGPKKGVAIQERPKPVLKDSTDAIVRIKKATIWYAKAACNFVWITLCT